ncbi:hypothetical protein GGF32_005090 [Allomyces javanicus]|nr:hypothetical protein GGF32_005090 [Allomyces javanicus]
MEDVVHFMILELDHTYLVWVGSGEGNMGNLAVATALGSSASASTLIGPSMTATSASIAKRLAARFVGNQFFVSYALDEANEMQAVWAERAVLEALRTRTSLGAPVVATGAVASARV